MKKLNQSFHISQLIIRSFQQELDENGKRDLVSVKHRSEESSSLPGSPTKRSGREEATNQTTTPGKKLETTGKTNSFQA